MSIKVLGRGLATFEPGQIITWLDAGKGRPVNRAAMVLEAVLKQAPRADVPALILADAALAQSLGWDYVVPLLAAGLKRADLRSQSDDLRLACHRALISSAIEAVRLTADLTRRAAHLKAVAPKLRAKAAGAAVEMFLVRDAVARPCCIDQLQLRARPTRDGIQAVRSKLGWPSPVIQLRTRTPILASVF